MKVCGIYKITSPSGSIYIGQSKNCYRRRYRYSKEDCKKQSRLYNSIKKYGWENHSFEIIHLCNEKRLTEWENFYIDKFDSFNTDKGLNLIRGGVSGERSSETKDKNRLATKKLYTSGKKERPIGVKNGMYGNGYKLLGSKNGRYGKEVSQETRDKISAANIISSKRRREAGTHKLSQEHKDKIRKALTGKKNCLGRKNSDATKLKMRRAALYREALKRSLRV